LGTCLLVAASATAEERALWISIGDTPTNLPNLTTRINDAHAAGCNSVVFLSRYRANAYYVPNRTDNTYPNPDPMASGVNVNNDPTQHVIDVAKGLGMRVYAAWPSLIVSDGSAAALPSHINTDWLQWWYSGSTQNTYTPSVGFPKQIVPSEVPPTNEGHDGYWLDPGVPAARAYVINVLRDFLTNYDVDGIILDRVRFPGDSSPRNTVAWGYNPLALAQYGLTDPPPNSTTFINARRAAVTTFVNEVYAAATQIKPWIIIGAAPVVYGSDLTSTYSFVFQHFPSWNTAVNPNKVSGLGNLDIIMPQLYRSSATTNRDLMDLIRPDVTNMRHVPLLRSFAVTGDTDLAVIGARGAINVCHTRNPLLGTAGSSFFAASGFLNGTFLTAFQSEVTTCGANVFGSPAAPIAFPDKLGWDATPPGTVGDLAGAQNDATVNLTWSAATDAVAYLLYRSTNPAVPITYANLVNKSAVLTGTSFTDPGPFSSGSSTFHYRLLAVDAYNNKAQSNIATVAVNIPEVILEVRDSLGNNVGAPLIAVSGSYSPTTAKSTAAGLTGTGSRFSTTVGNSITFTPAITVAGTYNIYTTLQGGAGNPSAQASVNWTVTTPAGGNASGNINLSNSNATFGNAWGLVASNVPFAAGSAGSVGSFTMTNVDGDGAGALPGNRFNPDSVRFVWTGPLSDTTAPTSTASATTTITNSTNLAINFTASDVGSGVDEVELFVQTPLSGSFVSTGLVQTGNGGTFNYTAAAGDGAYGFYTVATDNATNVESAPGVADVVVTLDTAAPTASATAPATKVTGAIAVGATLNGTGSSVATASLFVRKDNGSWSNAGSILSGSLNYTPIDGIGFYDFYVVPTDAAGNSRTIPDGASFPDATTLYVPQENNATLPVTSGQTVTFPMTDALNIVIDFTNATIGGPVQVVRTVGAPTPLGLNASRLINEWLSLTGTFTGTVNITWNYASTSADSLVLPINTVFQINGLTITPHPNAGLGTTVSFGTNSATINGATSFSDWFIGNDSASVADWYSLTE
jgi:uncharacterized lipoprotein YddW (UPF0748 family)